MRFDVCFAPLSLTTLARGDESGAVCDEIDALADLGVTQAPVAVRAATRAQWMTAAERLATELIGER